jgi:hypothetical protein
VDFDTIVGKVVAEGGFDTTSADVSTATVQGWVNEVYKSAVAESQWLMAQVTLASTVASQALYDLADNIADIRSLYLADDSGDPGDWSARSVEDLWGLQRGSLALSGSGGVFAITADASGAKKVQLWPVPTATGAPITALVALIPADLASGDTPAIPADTHGKLVDAAIGLGLFRVENRSDLSAAFEQRRDVLVQQLQRRKNSRAGSTPTRIQVENYDF